MEKLAKPILPIPLSSGIWPKSHEEIGFFLKDTGRPEEALAAWLKALAICQKLADANPAVSAVPKPPGRGLLAHRRVAGAIGEAGGGDGGGP